MDNKILKIGIKRNNPFQLFLCPKKNNNMPKKNNCVIEYINNKVLSNKIIVLSLTYHNSNEITIRLTPKTKKEKVE